MEQEKGKQPDALDDEALDEAAGGTVTFGGSLSEQHTGGVNVPDQKGTSFAGDGLGSSHSGGANLTKTGPGTLNFADGSVKPAP